MQNGRGNGVEKIGAVREGILRKSFLRGGKHLDQALWSILSEDWTRSTSVTGSTSNLGLFLIQPSHHQPTCSACCSLHPGSIRFSLQARVQHRKRRARTEHTPQSQLIVR